MHPMTAGEIRTYVGDVSDHLVARVLATGASTDELAQAALLLERERGAPRPDRTSKRVYQLCELISDEFESDIWPDD